MPNAALCEIVVILDRSGSMATVKKDMQGGFDSFVAEQRKAPGECVLTLVQFDTLGVELVHEAKPIDEVPGLDLVPRGGTPLLDAIGETITKVGERFARTAEEKRPGRVLFLIITDGHENASHAYSKKQIRDLVTRQTNDYQWQFMYLGANVDAFAEAQAMGVPVASTANYTQNTTGIKNAFVGASNAAVSYRSGGTASLTDEERKKMGGTTLNTPKP